ncbi:MAG: hypothetical protein ACRC0B_08190 [Legionella sp.]
MSSCTTIEEPYITWIKNVDGIKKKFGFRAEFDLFKQFWKLHTLIARHDFSVENLNNKAADLEIINKVIGAEKKIIALLEKTSSLTQFELNLLEQINSRKAIVTNLMHFIERYYYVKPQKKYPSSKTFAYITYLVRVFHKGTGKMPVCYRPNYADGMGNFYEFLIESKETLMLMGIDLQKDETIGKYADMIVNGHEKNGIKYQSYADEVAYLESMGVSQYIG